MYYIFHMNTQLLAALSARVKTNFPRNSWIIFFKFLKVNLGLGGDRFAAVVK